MTIIYLWKATQLQVAKTKDNLNNVVESVNWALTATENNFTAEISATTALNLPDQSTFVDFDKLTSSIVENWVKNSIGETVFNSYKTNLASLLKEKQNASNTEILNPPWSN